MYFNITSPLKKLLRAANLILLFALPLASHADDDYAYRSQDGQIYSSGTDMMDAYRRQAAQSEGNYGYSYAPGRACLREYPEYYVDYSTSPSTVVYQGSPVLSSIDKYSRFHMGCSINMFDDMYYTDTSPLNVKTNCSQNPQANDCVLKQSLPPVSRLGKPHCVAGAFCGQENAPVFAGVGDATPCVECGDPVNPVTGNNAIQVVDAEVPGSPLLKIVRYFNSAPNTPQGTIGPHWRLSFDYVLVVKEDGSLELVRPDGRVIAFNGGVSASDKGTLEATAVGYTYTNALGWVETYSTTGVIQSIVAPGGESLQFVRNSVGQLYQVVDGHGRALSFNYPSYLGKLTLPSGQTVEYSYGGSGYISEVKHSGVLVAQYRYGQYVPSTLPNASSMLSAIVDAVGVVQTSFSYDNGAHVSGENTSAGAALNFVYSAGGTQVTNQDGLTQTIVFDVSNGSRLNSMTTTCPGGDCVSGTDSFLYGSDGNQKGRVDGRGVQTCQSFEGRGLPVLQVEGVPSNVDCDAVLASPGSYPNARVTTTAWNATFGLPTAVAGPLSLKTYSYDTVGRKLSETVQETTDGNGSQGLNPTTVGPARTTTYGYDTAGNLASVTRTRSGSAETTLLGRDSVGNLTSIKDPAGYVTTFGGYDADGRPGTIIYPNGRTVSLGYDGLGRLTSMNDDGEVTSYGFDARGLMTTVTNPDGSALTFTYDAGHRLTDVADSAGNTVHRTLSAAGNITQQTTSDSTGALALKAQATFDALSRIRSMTKVQ